MAAPGNFRRQLSGAAQRRTTRTGRLLGRCLRLLARTLKITLHGMEHVRQAEAKGAREGIGSLFLVWHANLIIPALVTKDRGYTVLISPSADGDIAAAAMKVLGWNVVHGSPFLGGAAGVRGILRAIRKGGITAITPDGPRGPARQISSNLVRFIRQSGCSVYPVGAAVEDYRLNTWDKLSVPRPFGRGTMVIGDAVVLPIDDDAAVTQLQTAIDQCQGKASKLSRQQLRMSANRKNFILYNLLLAPLIPALACYTLWRRYGQKKSAASFRGQWGHVPTEAVVAFQAKAPRIWIHAVSVGETMAARPVVRALRAAVPACSVGLSVTTDTGYQTAQGLMKSGDIDALWYFPLDLPFTMRRAFRRLKPDVFISMETELWPNCLSIAKQSGATTLLVNGRVSDNLQNKAPKFRRLWSWMMGNIDMALMRSDFDAERLNTLPAQPEAVRVVGDVKLDGLHASDSVAEERAHWRELLGIGEGELLWVAGSTHDGEEAAMLRAYRKLREQFPQLRLLIAPRHIERGDEVAKTICDEGFKVASRSKLNGVNLLDSQTIILLDTVGELAQAYSAGDVAFVGGSLIKRGGHNMLEPVLRGVPVLYGPYIANFRETAKLVESVGAGRMVQDEEQLISVVAELLRSSENNAQLAQRTLAELAPHRGAAARVAQTVAELLSERAA